MGDLTPTSTMRQLPPKILVGGITYRRVGSPKEQAKGTPRIHSPQGPVGGFTPRARPKGHPVLQPVPHASLSSSEAETSSEGPEGLELPNEPVLEAVPQAGTAVQTTAPVPSGTFGIPSKKLGGDVLKQFENYYESARLRDLEKREKSSYETTKKLLKDADGKVLKDASGEECCDFVLERREVKKSVQFHAWQAANGKKVQTGFNKVGRVLHDVTGIPRTTGSNYGSDKGKGLINSTIQLPNDYASAVVFGARVVQQGAVIHAASSDTELAADLSPGTDCLAAAGAVTSGIDTVFAVHAHLGQVSEREKAKKDVGGFRFAARRFAKNPAGATSEDAEGFLKFMEAGEKLFDTPMEDASTAKAARDRAIRSPTTAVSNTVGAVLEGVNTVTAVTPFANLATLPLSLGAGFFEVHEGGHEFRRREGQKEQARSRKELMQEILRTTDPASPEYIAHADNELARGLIECFTNHQDHLEEQANREKIFARGRIFKGGAAIGAPIGAAAGIGTAALLGGLTAVTGGVAAVPVLAVGLGWGVALAARNHLRVRDEHDSKWEQRMVRAITFDTPRQELEAKLVGNLDIAFAQEEGQYLPEKGQFAGLRTLKLKACDNAYLGLHVLALKIQDLARGGTYDKNSPIMKLVHALGIDELRLLAICKAVSAKKDGQLDFIKSRLAPKLGIKFTVGAETQTEALPHPSVFIEHFNAAWKTAFYHRNPQNQVPHAAALYEGIREELEAGYPDPHAGMQAFHKAIKAFLQKTGDPKTDDLKMLKGFDEYLETRWAARETARQKFDELLKNKEKDSQKFDELVKNKKEQDERTAARQKFDELVKNKMKQEERTAPARTLKEADKLVRQLGSRKKADGLLQQLEQFDAIRHANTVVPVKA